MPLSAFTHFLVKLVSSALDSFLSAACVSQTAAASDSLPQSGIRNTGGRPSPSARGLPAACSRARLVFSARGVRTTSRCGGCRAVKRVKSACLGNAVAMMHYGRIVNSCGRQKWHGHDHYDGSHSTLPLLEWQRLYHNTTRLRPYSMFPMKVLRGCQLCTGLICMAITRPPLVCR